MLVFIGRFSPSTFRRVPMCQDFSHFSGIHVVLQMSRRILHGKFRETQIKLLLSLITPNAAVN